MQRYSTPYAYHLNCTLLGMLGMGGGQGGRGGGGGKYG